MYCPPILQTWSKPTGSEGLKNSMRTEASAAKIAICAFSLDDQRRTEQGGMRTHSEP